MSALPLLSRMSLVSLFVGLSAFAKLPARLCEPSLTAQRPGLFGDTEASIWESRSQVMINVGVLKPVTFAIDSEFTRFQTLSIIERGPFSQTLRARAPRVRVKEILAAIAREGQKISEKQFRLFGIRSGVSKDKATYNIFELTHYVADFLLPEMFPAPANPFITAELEDSGYLGMIDQSLKAIGLGKFKAYLDAHQIEIRNRTYDSIPFQFRKSVQALHDIETPDSHLRIGLPAEIPDKPLLSIARAIETVVILEMALEGSKSSGSLKYNGSTLNSNDFDLIDNSRGVVRVRRNRWSKPFQAHDFEIRQYFSLERGLDYVELAVKLAQNFNHLRYKRAQVLTETAEAPVYDPLTSNLSGALDYAGRILRDSSDANSRRIGRTLMAEAEKLYSGIQIKDSDRDRVAELLEKEGVIDLLFKGAFLEDEG